MLKSGDTGSKNTQFLLLKRLQSRVGVGLAGHNFLEEVREGERK